MATTTKAIEKIIFSLFEDKAFRKSFPEFNANYVYHDRAGGSGCTGCARGKINRNMAKCASMIANRADLLLRLKEFVEAKGDKFPIQIPPVAKQLVKLQADGIVKALERDQGHAPEPVTDRIENKKICP